MNNPLRHFPCLFRQGLTSITRVNENRMIDKRTIRLETCEWCGYVFIKVYNEPKTITQERVS